MPTRPLQRHDVDDPHRLFTYLSELEQDVHETKGTVIKQTAHIASLNRQLAQGTPALTIDSAPGVAANPQNPLIPVLTSQPDPNNTTYTLWILSGTPNQLWTIDTSVTPRRRLKIADLP